MTAIVINPGDGTFPEIVGDATIFATGRALYSASVEVYGDSSDSSFGSLAASASEIVSGTSAFAPSGNALHRALANCLGTSTCGPITEHTNHSVSATILGSSSCVSVAKANYSASEVVLGMALCSESAYLHGHAVCDLTAGAFFTVVVPTVTHNFKPQTPASSGLPVPRVGTPNYQAPSSVILTSKPVAPQPAGFAVKVKT